MANSRFMLQRIGMRALTMMRTLALATLANLVTGAAMANGVTVFAAASLKNALDEVADAWTAQGGGTVTISYAGSSTLARQIEAGAPSDVFISANSAWMDALEEAGLLAVGARVDLLGNTLVVISRAPAEPFEIADLSGKLGDSRIAMALVDAVPAGIYGKAALEQLGLWREIAPRVAQADNVRAALALVAMGEARFGVVYATDVAAERRVSVVAAVPGDAHPAIVYPAAITRDGDGPAARAFLAFLESDAAAATFSTHGFEVR